MTELQKAIIHLHEAGWTAALRASSRVRRLRVRDIGFDIGSSILTVHFDATQTSLAEIVREIEDSGTRVTGIARRCDAPSPATPSARPAKPWPEMPKEPRRWSPEARTVLPFPRESG